MLIARRVDGPYNIINFHGATTRIQLGASKSKKKSEKSTERRKKQQEIY